MMSVQVYSGLRIATAAARQHALPVRGRELGVPVTVRRNFALNLKRALKEAGLTQKDLGEKIGVTQKAVSRWMQQVDWPDSRNIDKIAAALGIEYSELFKNPDEFESHPPDSALTIVLRGKPDELASALSDLQSKWSRDS